MQVSRTTVLRWILAGMIGLSGGVWPALTPSHAGDQPQPRTIQFTLDRPLDAAAAPFVMASVGGLFSAEGLAVGTNVATSSADAIARVADGSSDFALVDINALIGFRDKPGAAPVKAVFVLFNQAPYAIIARKSRGIKALADMEGKNLGVAEGDLSIRLWPAVARQNGIKLSSVKQNTISAAVREPMLSAGQVDAVTGFSYLSAINLRDRGVPADDLAVLRFADYGCEAYGFAVIVSPRLATAKPDAVKGFVRAVIGGTNLAIKDPARAEVVVAQLNAMGNGQWKAWTRQQLADANAGAMFEEGILVIIIGGCVVLGIIIGVAAVIAVVPLVNGLAAGRVAYAQVGGAAIARSTATAVASSVGRRLGRGPKMMRVVGEPGDVGAALTAPGFLESYRAIAGPSWRNEVDASVGLEIGSFRVDKHAARVDAPVLFQIADFDSAAPPYAASKTAFKAHAEVRHYPCDHFDIFAGNDFFEPCVTHEIGFLRRHLASNADVVEAATR